MSESEYETLPNGNIKVPLSGGQYAEVRTVGDLRRADERAILDQADKDGVDLSGNAGQLSSMAALQDAVAARMVRRWTVTGEDGEPLSATSEGFQELRSVDSTALIRATAGTLKAIFQNMSESADPKSGPASSSPDAKDNSAPTSVASSL